MKKTIIKGLVSTVFLTGLFSFAAFAATINTVSFTARTPEDYIGDTGESATIADPWFVSGGSGGYELVSYEALSSSTSISAARSYELTFAATYGNSFNSSSAAITVTGQGVESIASKRVTDGGDTLIVRVRAYPYVKLPATTISALPESGATRLELSRGSGVGTVEYYLVYTDNYGESRTVHNTTTSSRINVSNYTRAYTGTRDDMQDREVTGFWCRSLRASSNNSNPNIVPSDWSGTGDQPLDAYLDNYNSWMEYLGDGSSGGSTSSAGSSSGSGSVTTSAGWIQSGGYWYYRYQNGTYATGWIQVDGHWYYCDLSTGRMLTGWIQVDGHRYYLSPYSGGPMGSMVTGWISDGSYWYYFSPYSGGPMGSLMTGWIQVDGRWYYSDPSTGRMLTGWIQVDGHRYYLSPYSGGPLGSMVTGWISDGGYWYYLSTYNGGPLGSMSTGWIQVDGHWYYCDPSTGRMVTGWFTDTDGQRYYLSTQTGGPYGSMLTGWQVIGGQTYFFRSSSAINGSLGAAIINSTVSINGVSHTFGANGVLIN